MCLPGLPPPSAAMQGLPPHERSSQPAPTPRFSTEAGGSRVPDHATSSAYDAWRAQRVQLTGASPVQCIEASAMNRTMDMCLKSDVPRPRSGSEHWETNAYHLGGRKSTSERRRGTGGAKTPIEKQTQRKKVAVRKVTGDGPVKKAAATLGCRLAAALRIKAAYPRCDAPAATYPDRLR